MQCVLFRPTAFRAANRNQGEYWLGGLEERYERYNMSEFLGGFPSKKKKGFDNTLQMHPTIFHL